MRACIQETEGLPPVVYGMGETDAEAMVEALDWSGGVGTGFRCVEIDEATRAHIVECSGYDPDFIVIDDRLVSR